MSIHSVIAPTALVALMGIGYLDGASSKKEENERVFIASATQTFQNNPSLSIGNKMQVPVVFDVAAFGEVRSEISATIVGRRENIDRKQKTICIRTDKVSSDICATFPAP